VNALCLQDHVADAARGMHAARAALAAEKGHVHRLRHDVATHKQAEHAACEALGQARMTCLQPEEASALRRAMQESSSKAARLETRVESLSGDLLDVRPMMPCVTRAIQHVPLVYSNNHCLCRMV
jgi:hypothetical protein